MMTNVADGWNSLSWLLAKKHEELQFQVLSSEEGASYPINRIEIWRKGCTVRTILAMKDSDRWLFSQEGVVESFEQPSLYKKRRIRDRLTREIIIQYLRSVGWDIERDDFWKSLGRVTYYDELAKSDAPPKTTAAFS